MPETHPSDDVIENDDEPADGELSRETVERAERLTRLAHDAVDDAEAEAYREERSELLDPHDFRARVREEDTGETLVLHPDEWLEDGVIRTDRIEDTGRAVEVSLSGPGDPDEWESVEEHNREVAARVRDEYGDVHGDNAAAFADFMGNHYARPVESATTGEVEEFCSEYFPRNAWPTEKQRAAVEESLELVFEVADE
ncbi:rnhA operon protein [Halorussus gelatinilyticus]|uniref:RnhA operon protein n=1 Tax=Halorussus gelatinilyticus TaxID=2937524 RepID=A0A8U0IH11_9EURY|nr:rnhA operon protein [Halorussus gelatinilyticus]UPV99358.1 rnhA operon protein [Halorussus gelatinilyticus]